MNCVPYLNLAGACEAALHFYQRALGAEVLRMSRFGESPMGEEIPSEWRDKIMHLSFRLGDSVLMASDGMPGENARITGVSLAISNPDPAEAERQFKALSDGGEIRMPWQSTFWAKGFGMCVDRFGVPWMVNCE